MNLCLINGQPGQIPANHRALAYGDGLFETLKVNNGVIEFLDEHLQRLSQSATRLKLAWSAQDQQNLQQQLLQLVDQNNNQTQVLKIMLLRCSAGRGYGFNEQQTTDCVIQLMPYVSPAWLKQDVRLELAASFASENPSLAGMKHLNRLDSVLARASVPIEQAEEVLLANASGLLVEGSMSNVFVRIDGSWQTPKLDSAGVDGIIRQKILAQKNAIQPADIRIGDLERVDSAFICNSLIGIVPVSKFQGRPLQQDSLISDLLQEIYRSC